jgi:hypothetical protein
MNQRVSTAVGTLIIVIMVLTAAAFLFKVVNFDMQNWYQPIATKLKKKSNQTACTTEAKLCPDGSYVGRSGPNCEFAACPGESAADTYDRKAYQNENNSNFFETGIKLTFENKSDEFKKVEPVSFKICDYDGGGYAIEAQCNVLAIQSIVLNFGKGEGINESQYKKEFTDIIDKIKKYNARIIQTDSTLSMIVVELKDDKNIEAIKRDLMSPYFRVSYNMTGTFN